jgi:hypothetical protein
MPSIKANYGLALPRILTEEGAGAICLYVRDPDGVILKLVQRPRD